MSFPPPSEKGEYDSGCVSHALGISVDEPRSMSNSPTTPKSQFSAPSIAPSSIGGSTKALLGNLRMPRKGRHRGSNGSGPDDHGRDDLTVENMSAHNRIHALERPIDEGWPLLSRLMEIYPEFEAFARFRELHVKNLLYYQVELDFLRGQLEFKERQDWKAQKDLGECLNREKFFRRAGKMVELAFDKKECRQWDLVIKLRETLHNYDNAMLQYAKLSALPEPGRRNMQELRNWIRDADRGNFTIAGEGAQVWGELYKDNDDDDDDGGGGGGGNDGRNTKDNTSWTLPELVTLRPHQKMNALEGWIAYSFLPSVRKYAHRIRGYMRRTREETLPHFETKEGLEQEEKRKDTKKKEKKKKDKKKKRKKGKSSGDPKLDGITVVPVSVVIKATSLASTMVACLVPTMAIAVLTTTAADSKLQKLVWIGGFTILFAMGLTTFASEISRVQVFMAAAAFSAVLVVFIQN